MTVITIFSFSCAKVNLNLLFTGNILEVWKNYISLDMYHMVVCYHNSLKISDTPKLKFDQHDFTIQLCVQRMQMEWQTV